MMRAGIQPGSKKVMNNAWKATWSVCCAFNYIPCLVALILFVYFLFHNILISCLILMMSMMMPDI